MNAETIESRNRCLERLRAAKEKLARHEEALVSAAVSRPLDEWRYLAMESRCGPRREQLEKLAAVREEYNEWWQARAVVKSIYRHFIQRAA